MANLTLYRYAGFAWIELLNLWNSDINSDEDNDIISMDNIKN